MNEIVELERCTGARRVEYPGRPDSASQHALKGERRRNARWSWPYPLARTPHPPNHLFRQEPRLAGPIATIRTVSIQQAELLRRELAN
jgi:hypothetical protein